MFTPFAYIKSPSPIPLEGLVAWYDAADYTSGATWVDRSENGLDLTLNGTYSRSDAAGPKPYIWFETGAWGYSSNTSFSTNDLTIIQIMRGYPDGVGDTSWAIGNGEVSNYIYTQTIDGQNPVSPVGVWHNGNTGYYASGSTPLLVGELYPSLVSQGLSTDAFFSYNVSSGFGVSSGLTIKVGDSFYQTLGGGFTNTLWRSGAFNTNYDIVGSNNIIIGAFDSSGTGVLPARYGVYIIYNRILSSQETQAIYDYYKPIYGFL